MIKGEVLATADTWEEMRVHWDRIVGENPGIDLCVEKEIVDGVEKQVIYKCYEDYRR
jgi:hypothetical protein